MEKLSPLMRPYGLVIQRGFRVETAQEKVTFYIGEGTAFRDHSGEREYSRRWFSTV